MGGSDHRGLEAGRPWRREASTRAFWSRYGESQLAALPSLPRNGVFPVEDSGSPGPNFICLMRCLCIPKRAGVGSIIFLLWSAERHKVLDWELA